MAAHCVFGPSEKYMKNRENEPYDAVAIGTVGTMGTVFGVTALFFGAPIAFAATVIGSAAVGVGAVGYLVVTSL